MWDLDYITSTKIYAQTVQGLANFAQKFMSVLCKPGSTQPFAYFIARGWTVPDYYNYALIARIPSLTWPDRYFLRNGAY